LVALAHGNMKQKSGGDHASVQSPPESSPSYSSLWPSCFMFLMCCV